MRSTRRRVLASPLFLDQPRDDFSNSTGHGINLGVKAIDLGTQPTNFNCEPVDLGVEPVKLVVHRVKLAVHRVKSSADLLKSLLDILLEAKEVEMDLSKGREQKSNLSFHLTHPLFQPRDAIFKRCRGHGCSWVRHPL